VGVDRKGLGEGRKRNKKKKEEKRLTGVYEETILLLLLLMRERRVKAKIAHRPPASRRRRRIFEFCFLVYTVVVYITIPTYIYIYIYAKPLCNARAPYALPPPPNTHNPPSFVDRKYLRKRLKRARRRRPLPVSRPDRAEEGGGGGNNQLRDGGGGGGWAMDACARGPRGGRGRGRWAGLTTIVVVVVVVPFTDFRRPSSGTHARTAPPPRTPPRISGRNQLRRYSSCRYLLSSSATPKRCYYCDRRKTEKTRNLTFANTFLFYSHHRMYSHFK